MTTVEQEYERLKAKGRFLFRRIMRMVAARCIAWAGSTCKSHCAKLDYRDILHSIKELIV